MKECPDLRTLPGGYRWFYSEDHIAGGAVDPWDLEFRGKFGTVYPLGRDLLGAFTASARKGKELLRIAGVTPHQYGDVELVAAFAVELLPAVAEVMQLRKKKVLSEETKARLRENLAAAR